MIWTRKRAFFGATMLLTALLLQRCANVVAPTGGMKDTQPPMVTEAVPANHSTGFVGDRISITFDEYVVLENASQEVLISPPLKGKPDIKLGNKTVTVKFKEPLRDSTTYTINFGKAIKDLHEGNVFNDYTYSFSTGNALDSLTITGKVVSANDKKPVENVFVTLYDGDRDSLYYLPFSTIPDRITKTDKNGGFRFSGLADKRYYVFAVKDLNSNYLFDLANEEVAFLDTLVAATPASKQEKNGSVVAAQNPANADKTAITDSVPVKQHIAKANDLTLYMFAEIDTTQALLEKRLVEKGLLRFVFRHPADDVSITTPDRLPERFHIIPVTSAQHDTILWYFTPDVIDSLTVHINYDTLIHDSTRYGLTWKDSKKAVQKERKTKADWLTVKDNLKNGCLMPDEALTLKFPEPVIDYRMHDTASIKADSVVTYNGLEFEKADEYGFRYKLKFNPKEGVQYAISVPDSVFFGIRGLTNDKINIKFHRANDDEYGSIFITVVPPAGARQVVVQLLNDKSAVIGSHVITKEEEVPFWYLTPGKYKVRAIIDADADGKWSTGNYHHRFLPETIIDYEKPLEVRSGWDINLNDAWRLK